jgi:hypothetical protein
MWTALESVDKDVHAVENFEKSIFRIPVGIRIDDVWDVHFDNMVIQKSDTMDMAAYKCYKVSINPLLPIR